MEVWNLVFMQSSLGDVRTKVDFDIAGDLPKNIDTGMGRSGLRRSCRASTTCTRSTRSTRSWSGPRR